MLTISKALSSSQAQTYHAKEFVSAEQNYWKQDGAVIGEWHGRLAERLGLSGRVSEEHFARLAEGQHPLTGEQLVRHRVVREYERNDGSKVAPVEHRAGWDATFSAPKSVSLTALVGGDDRVREAHRAAVDTALTELERYTQARLGGNRPVETTGAFVVAKFEHDTARPVDGYAAPQLHTHAVIFNVTERENGQTRALQERALFESQQFATAVYQSELTYRLRSLGYEIAPGRSGAPEIKGYTQEYLDASSPRSQQIRAYLERSGFEGHEAAQIAAHSTRDSKKAVSVGEAVAAHRKLAAEFGHQADRVVEQAHQRALKPEREHQPERQSPHQAVNYARDRNFEREAVVDERRLYRDALRRGMGELTLTEIRSALDERMASGEFQIASRKAHASARQFTTEEMIRAEKEVIARVLEGQNRSKQIAGQDTVPVRIQQMSDAEALEAQLVENLIRSEIHPMEEAQGFRALLGLEEPKYSIEQIAAKVGKSPAFIASRLKLTDLVPEAVEAFYADEIGVGHALLLAKLPADQQKQALSACFKEVYSGNSQKPTRILLPVRNLQFWIDANILLNLKDAPFNKHDAQLVPTAGSCADCPKRTGHNKLLFGDDLGKQGDRCTDPTCYQAKVQAHVAATVAAKPELVQISTAYGAQRDGSSVLPRNKYTAIRDDKPKSKDDAKRPEFKVCKFTTEAIITEGSHVGTIHKVCANPACPIHHPKQSSSRDEKWKTEQEKQRREQAIASATGLRVLSAVGDAVPVRLMKRDLFFVLEKLTSLMDENRLAMLARQHGIRQKRDDGGVAKTFGAFLRRADEGTLSRLLVETAILLAASRTNITTVLRDAASTYKVDTDAITAKVKQEFAAKEKGKKAAQGTAKPAKKAAA